MKRLHWLKFTPSVILGLLVTGVAGLGWLVVCLPQLQTASLSQKIKGYETSPQSDPKELAMLEKGRIDTENAIRAALIQGLGGMAVLIGAYFAYQNLKATQRNVLIAEDKQMTERFGKAVEMLSSTSMHTRLGGIYALERIANDSDKDYPQVMEVLTAFVREESPYPPQDTAWGKEPESKPVETEERAADSQSSFRESWKVRQRFRATIPALRTDLQAVLTVIGRRKYRYRANQWETQRLDLSKTDLRKLEAQGANLTGVDLFKAHLEGANLKGADLVEAILKGADLSHVEFLTQGQLDQAFVNEGTRLPSYLVAKKLQLSKTEAPPTSIVQPLTPLDPSAETPPSSEGTST